MGAYDSLKSLVRQYIKTNGQNEITGQILQNVLIAMIDDLGITIDPTPTKNSSNAVSSGGTFDMIQDATNVNAIESADGKIYNDYQAGDIFFIVDNNVRKYRVALVAGTADAEHPVTISPVNFYYALNSADAINLSLTLKTVSTEQQSLSSQQKAQARTNIAAVSYDQQSLSADQQVQAQNNMMGKAYAPAQNSGLGKVYLDKNNGVLTQTMMQATNTVYVIQYDYDLNGQTITIPQNCILLFEGGSLSNGDVVGNNTKINTEDIKIFENIILDGSFINKIDVRMYGLIPSSSVYSPLSGATNANIINNYIIPSATNLTKEIYFPPKVYAFSSPIVFNGTYDVICDGTLVYNGSDNTTFITVGETNNGHTHRNYKFDLFGVVPQAERTNISGIKFINTSYANITIKTSIGFTGGIELIGDMKGSGFNKFYCNRIEGDVYALRFTSKGTTGWANQNYIYGGYFISLEGCSIWLNGEGYHYVNGNMFYAPSFENSEVGVKLTHANANYITDVRFESVRVPVQILNGSSSSLGSGKSSNNIITYAYEAVTQNVDDVVHNGINKNFYMPSASLYETKMTTLYNSYYILYRKDGNYELASNLTTAYIKSDYSEGRVVQEIGTKLTSNADNLLVGFVVNLSVAQYYAITLSKYNSTEPGSNRFFVAILDNEYKFINIEDNYDSYIDELSTDFAVSSDSSLYLATGSTLSCSIRFKTNNTLAFIGFKCLNIQDFVKFDAYSKLNPIVYPIPVNTMSFIPDSIIRIPYQEALIGKSIYNITLNKPVFWTGDTTKGNNGWVDANGNNPSNT